MNDESSSAHFDRAAAGWDADPLKVARSRATAAAIVRRVPIRPDFSGFEFGCGTGLLSFALRPHLARITLADSSPGMLDVLRQKIAEAGIDGMTPLKLDLEVDAPPTERYDLVYSLMSFHHVANLDRLLRKLRSLLRPSGYLCVADLDREDGSFHGAGFSGHNGFDRDDLARRAQAAGFGEAAFETVFVIAKTVAGQERRYPVFLMVCRAD